MKRAAAAACTSPGPPTPASQQAKKRGRRGDSDRDTAAAAAVVAVPPRAMPPPPPPPLAPWTPATLAAAAARLSSLHPTLSRLHAAHGVPVDRLLPVPAHHHFGVLAKSIAAQQVSSAAANTIHGRVVTAVGLGGGGGGGGSGPSSSSSTLLLTPAAVAATPPDALRAAGLSGRKVTYLHALAAAFCPGGALAGVDLQALDDAALTASLTALPGIGSWTAHMFSMFALGRQDVLPCGDLGIKKGVALVFNSSGLPSPAQMEALTATWAPHRSLACWWLWRLVGEGGAGGVKREKKAGG